jgi:hypothetical protein
MNHDQDQRCFPSNVFVDLKFQQLFLLSNLDKFDII